MTLKTSILTGFTAALIAQRAGAVDNGLARTPQMGWNNWNSFGCDVSESLLVSTAEMIITLGFKDLGYHYVVLDDCWSAGRNASANNSLIHNDVKFPRGMAAVADDIHAMNLGFGMYSDAGRYTCGGYEGSLGHEDVDAQTFASWGVDYLKYDNCYNMGQAGNQQISEARYRRMGDALNATGRPILYSLCNWGEDYPWNWGPTVANSWRITGDVDDTFDQYDPRCPCEGGDAWDCGLPGFHCSVSNIINKASFVTSKAGKGGWNDLDMLEVGNEGLTENEWISHFALWSAVKSPLIMGNDIRKITPAALSILSNAAVIAVSQDPLGSSAARRWLRPANGSNAMSRAESQLWSGSLNSTTGGTYNDMVVLLINGDNEEKEMEATLADIFFDQGPGGSARQNSVSWEVRDLLSGRMSDATAKGVIDRAMGNGTVNGTISTQGRYNATKVSYPEGLLARDETLLGNLTTTVAPRGTITAKVGSHGAAMFRLRAVGATRKRDEL